ncbi:TVP38/TMEM64 family protein, partial [uncultured Dubosiella sp.]|uniref:TVP38/TMEM64 family protein n=1 Tax=uncultured Dubosiella sp. TaxID=1937011 RepID=UPI0026328720
YNEDMNKTETKTIKSENHAAPKLGKDETKWRKWILIGGTIVLILIMWYFFHNNYFKDPQKLQHLIQRAGVWGPVLFIIFQALQVIVPVLPGGVSGSLAMLCFGTWTGYLYSYIGVILGSCLAFWLVRRYGVKILSWLVSEQTFDKYYTKLQNSKNFTKYFAILIFLPVAPDDLLCMIAGLTKMKFRTFLIIILLGKPVSSFFYSYFIMRLMRLI